MASTVFSIICLIIEFIVLLFIVLSIGLDVLKLKKKIQDPLGCTLSTIYFNDTEPACSKVCFGMWGVKRCGAHKPRPFDLPYWGYPSKKVKQLANCAGAFDIVSAVVVLVAFILGFLVVCRCMSAWVLVGIYVFAVITIIIAIGCLLGIYYYNAYADLAPTLGTALTGIGMTIKAGDLKLKELFNLYSAAGLIVCGWCLQVINLILMILNACCCSSAPSAKSSPKESPREAKSNHEPEDEEL